MIYTTSFTILARWLTTCDPYGARLGFDLEADTTTGAPNALILTNHRNRDSICFHGLYVPLAIHIMKLYLRKPKLVVCDKRME